MRKIYRRAKLEGWNFLGGLLGKSVSSFRFAHFAQSVLRDVINYEGLRLFFNIALSALFPAAVAYMVFRERDLSSYVFVLVVAVVLFVTDVMLLLRFASVAGLTATFTDPTFAVRNSFYVAEIILTVPVVVLTYPFFRPLFDAYRKIRTMNDTGLVTYYASVARDNYAHWMQRDAEA
jgi:hypothetical protein